MEIIRDNRFDGTFSLTLDPSTTYTVKLIDENTFEEFDQTVVSDSEGNLVIVIPTYYNTYDGWLSLQILDGTEEIYFDLLSIVRPYCDIDKVAEELASRATRNQTVQYERIARQLIDNMLGYPFVFVRKTIKVTGNGTDYLQLPGRMTKIYSVKENGETLWETGDPDPFEIEGSFLTRPLDENKLEYNPQWKHRYGYPTFPSGYDYAIDGDFGWRVVPQDIRDAASMIVIDIGCGNNRYHNKYMQFFNNGTTTFRYSDYVYHGTGNAIVDKILERYVMDSINFKAL